MFREKARKCVKPCFFSRKDSKRPHQQVTATTSAGNTKSGRLLYIQDLESNRRFLVDTGAEISVIPPFIPCNDYKKAQGLGVSSDINSKDLNEE